MMYLMYLIIIFHLIVRAMFIDWKTGRAGKKGEAITLVTPDDLD